MFISWDIAFVLKKVIKLIDNSKRFFFINLVVIITNRELNKIIALILKEKRMLNTDYNQENIQDIIINLIANKTELDSDEIEIDKTFASYNIDSVLALEISGELEELLKVKINPIVLFEYPTIESLAKYLVELK
jgi:acyl carrier protein